MPREAKKYYFRRRQAGSFTPKPRRRLTTSNFRTVDRECSFGEVCHDQSVNVRLVEYLLAMMQAPTISSTILRRVASSSPWTCAQCRNHVVRRVASRPDAARRYATSRFSSSAKQSAGPSRRRLVLLAATGGAAGASILAFTDDIKQSYESAERAGRVASALGICINEYGYLVSIGLLALANGRAVTGQH